MYKCVCVCVCTFTHMAGSSCVSGATTVAAECVPSLGTAATVLAVDRNTPDMTERNLSDHRKNISRPNPFLACYISWKAVDLSAGPPRVLYLSIMAHISRLTFSKLPIWPCSTALRSARWSSMWIICMQPWKER